MNKKFLSIACAVACSFLWGTAFVAQDTGMDYIGPWTFSAARLILGFLVLFPFVLIFELKKILKTKIDLKFVIAYLFLLGFLLAGGNIFQQISLLYTDVANSAVFTVLYVVIVPIIAYFIFSKKIHKFYFFVIMILKIIDRFLKKSLISWFYEIVCKITCRSNDNMAIECCDMWSIRCFNTVSIYFNRRR